MAASTLGSQAIEDQVQAAIQEASQQTGVPASVLQFIHQNEVNINLQGPGQGTFTNPQGFGGFFGLPSNMLSGGDPYQQAISVAHLLQSYGANTWQDAIRIFNAGPNGSLSSSYAANYNGSGGPTGVISVSGVGPGASAQGGMAAAGAGAQDFVITNPLTGQPWITIPGTAWLANGGGWKLLFTLIAVALIIIGAILYFKGEVPTRAL